MLSLSQTLAFLIKPQKPSFQLLCPLYAQSQKMSNSSKKRKTESAEKSETKLAKTTSTPSISVFEGAVLKTEEEVRKRDGYKVELPKKDKNGVIIFSDCKDLRPNMTPKEILQSGSFGGTYFRPIKSSITGLKYNKQWLELPQEWLEGLEIKKTVASSIYNERVNTYGKKCGGDLDMWESSGWIKAQDPYGWFQWYCRYYLGRRTKDDARQIQRWKNCTGPKGRWKNTLIGKIIKTESAFDNKNISPVIRQTLQHWGYRLTKEDFEARKKLLKKQGK